MLLASLRPLASLSARCAAGSFNGACSSSAKRNNHCERLVCVHSDDLDEKTQH